MPLGAHAGLLTPRLRLRPLDAADVDALAAIYADPETMRFIADGATATLAETRAHVDRHRALTEAQGYGLWATELRATGELIGRCGLMHWPDIGGRAELEVGYLIARRHWGCGYATEAALAARDFALDQLGAERLVSLIRPANQRSKAVARKLGMAPERSVELHAGPVDVFALTSPGLR